jgi:hypothetical protein
MDRHVACRRQRPREGDETIRLQLDSRSAAPAAALGAIALSAMLALVGSAQGGNPTTLPAGCGPRPSWIAAATLSADAQDPLPSCLSAQSSQAEAVLSIANDRPYAQLVTVTGAVVEETGSSFARPLERTLSALLAGLGSGAGPMAFVLAAGQSATLTLDRPAPGAAREIHIDPASDNAFAVAAVTFTLLSAAAERRLLSPATEGCVASVLYRALRIPPQPEQAFRRVHACVNAASLPRRAQELLRGLASRLLRGRFFKQVIRREGTEPRPARIALTLAASNPELINPDIHLGPAGLGTVPGGRTTVEHLSATGGTPPYRFYLVPEPGGPGVPSWLHLAADGTLTLEPPAGVAAVTLPVEVVDSNGEHSVVSY